MKKYYAYMQYSLIQAGVWAIYGALLCYAQNYLLSQKLSNIIVSSILGVACVSTVLLQMILTECINRWKGLTLNRVIILLSCAIFSACGILMWIPISAAAAAVIYGTGVVCLQMLPAFVNAMGMSALQSGRNINYGIARGTGSAAFALISFFVGRWIASSGYDVILITTMVLCAILALASILFTIGQSKLSQQEESTENPGLLQFIIHHKKFSLFLFGCILCAISHSLTTNYIFQITVSKGGTSADQGIASAIAGLLELPAMFLFIHMVKWVRCDTWVKISGLFFALKALFLYLATNVTGLYGAMCFQLLGYALFTVSSVYYTGSVISPKYVIHSQSYLFATSTIGSILALLIGGTVLEALDIQVLMLLAVIFGLVAFLLFLVSTEKVSRI